MADFKETLSICEHNGILGHQTRFWDYTIIQEDLADGKTKVIKWDIALDAEHISKLLMDWADTLEEGRKLVAKFCKFDFCKSQYLEFKTEY